MGFVLQLRLLLWKNYILRKRHWMRLLAEICWPLILFLILAAVRSRGLRTYYHECHFEEKVMPSAGFLPYAQSLVCSFNNTCHRYEQVDQTRLGWYNGSTLTQLLEDLHTALSINIDSEEDQAVLGNITKDISTLRSIWTKFSRRPGEAVTDFTSSLNVSSLVKNPIQLRNEVIFWAISANLTDLAGTLPGIMDAFFEAKLRPNAVTSEDAVSLALNPRKAICSSDLLSKVIVSANLTQSDFEEALKPLCSLSWSEIRKLLSLLQKQINWESLQIQVQNYTSKNGDTVDLEDWQKLLTLSARVGGDLLESSTVKMLLSPVANLTRDFLDLTKSLGSRGMALLESPAAPPEPNDEEGNFLEQGLEDTSRIYAKFQKVVCGRDLNAEQAAASLFAGGSQTQLEKFRESLKVREDANFTYNYDNTTSPECNEIMEQMESNPITKFIWAMLKPYIRGKILYTPDTPATRRLVAIVNRTFAPLDKVRVAAQQYVDTYSKQLRQVLFNQDVQEFFKDFFVSGQNDSTSLFEAWLESPMGESIVGNDNATKEALQKTVQDLFEGNYNETWNATLNKFDEFVASLSLYLSCFEFNKFIGMQNELKLEELGIQLVADKQLWAGLVFVNMPANQKSDDLPHFIQYKIRMDAETVDGTLTVEDRVRRPIPRRRPQVDLKYIYFGFSFLQDLLEHAIISEQSGRPLEELPGISLQQFPYPCSVDDKFVTAISGSFPLLMTLSWIYSSAMIVKSIVYEKEKRLKETMRVMGLENAVHWIAWFVDSFTVMSISMFLLTLLLKFGNILMFSDITVIFAFLLVYLIASIMFSFMVSTLFNRANLAASVGGFLFYLSYLPYSFLRPWETKITHSIRISVSLLSNSAFGYGCGYLAQLEESGEGATWGNIWTSPLLGTGDEYSMAGVIGMLLIDSIIYGLIAWYIEAVWPGEYGVPRPWYFFITRSYWLGPKPPSGVSPSDSDLELGGLDARAKKNVEKEPGHLPLGVSIQHLHKVYSNGKVAIEDLNLNFYEGQITSFLGHNGAGKTTTMSILTGLFPPSAGTAKINGFDIRTDMDGIRHNLGVCPQHNVLFDNLTVDEHLWFYARLKGIEPQVVLEESEKMLDDLVLKHKRKDLSKNLSGGMQRKLSIATAFVGNSKVVILDEPTAGVDPFSRRGIWNLLIKYKANRTIIMSTHFMDEADLLGDRIAIINNGKLVSVGSSLYLKSRFGNGYYLTLVVDDGSEDVAKSRAELESKANMIPDDDDDSDTSEGSEDELKKSKSFDDIDAILSSPPSRNTSAVASSTRSIAVKESTPASELDLVIDDEGISDVAKVNGIVINPSKTNQVARAFPITQFVQRYIVNAQLLEHIGNELTYILPIHHRHGNSLKDSQQNPVLTCNYVATILPTKYDSLVDHP